MSNNNEIPIIQMIERSFQDEALRAIIRYIGQNHQSTFILTADPRLNLFLRTCLTQLFAHQSTEIKDLGISMINEVLSKYRKLPLDSLNLLDQFIMHHKVAMLVEFYEMSFLQSYEQAKRKLFFNHYKEIVMEDKSKDQVTQSILTKMDQVYGNTDADFDTALFESCDQIEQDRLLTLIDEHGKKPPPTRTSTHIDKLFQSLPKADQDKIKSGQEMMKFRQSILEQKTPTSLSQAILFAQLQDKLVYMLEMYLKIKLKKIKVGEIQKLVDDINKLKFKEQFQEISGIEKIKYFYKCLKLRKLSGEPRMDLQTHKSFRKTILEKFMEDLQKKADIPKHIKQLNMRKNWKQTYKDLYHQLSNCNPNTDDAIKIFEFIKSIQKLMISYLRFRTNYLYLYCYLIVEHNATDQTIDSVFQMMWSTTREQLDLNFKEILKKAVNVEASPQLMQFVSSAQQCIIIIEHNFSFVFNKLMHFHLRLIKFQNIKPALYDDLSSIEIYCLSELNENATRMLIYDKFKDQIQQCDNTEKESRVEYFQTLKIFQLRFQSLDRLSIFRQLNKSQVDQLKKKLYFISSNPDKLEELKINHMGLKPLLEREARQYRFMTMILEREVETTQDQYQKEAFTYFKEMFIQDSPFPIFVQQIYKCFAYTAKKQPSLDRWEHARYIMNFYNNDQESIQHMTCNLKGQEGDLVRQPLAKQFEIAKNLYNNLIEYVYLQYPQIPQSQIVQLNKITEDFPTVVPDDINSYNTHNYNFACFFLHQILEAYRKELYVYSEAPRWNEFFANKSLVDNDNYKKFTTVYAEFRMYKTLAIKDAQNNPQFTEKLIEIFGKYASLSRIKNEVIQFKRERKLNCNDEELKHVSRQFWSKLLKQEPAMNEQEHKTQIELFFKSLLSLSYQQQYATLQKAISAQSTETAIIRQMVQKYFDPFQKEMEMYQVKSKPKSQVLVPQSVHKKLQSLKVDRYKDFQTEDPSTIQYIHEQFEQFMKNMMGQIFQVVLTQKPGNEFKVYQSRIDSTQEHHLKYKQVSEMQRIYGPQQNSNIDMTLQTTSEQKPYILSYTLCDLTPIQRSSDFRKFMVEIEPIQDEIMKNKIRQNKWREEHPHLQDILQKKIKKGTELWKQVQDFLCKREVTNQSSDEDSEADIQDQAKQQEEVKDISKLKDEIYEKLKGYQSKQQQEIQNTMQTRLKNMESNDHLINQKEISIRTVQFVLEGNPFYRKSRILYKSYLF